MCVASGVNETLNHARGGFGVDGLQHVRCSQCGDFEVGGGGGFLLQDLFEMCEDLAGGFSDISERSLQRGRLALDLLWSLGFGLSREKLGKEREAVGKKDE